MAFSFIDLFKIQKNIPVAILLDPLIRKLKQAYLGEEKSD